MAWGSQAYSHWENMLLLSRGMWGVGMPSLPPAQPRETPPQAMELARKMWDEGAQQQSRDWDIGIGKATIYKGQIPVTKINLCFPSLPPFEF